MLVDDLHTSGAGQSLLPAVQFCEQ